MKLSPFASPSVYSAGTTSPYATRLRMRALPLHRRTGLMRQPVLWGVMGCALLFAGTKCRAQVSGIGTASGGTASAAFPAPRPWPQDPVAMPEVGAHRLQVMTPTLLELEFVTTKEPDPAPIGVWDFAKTLPAPEDFVVEAGGQKIAVKSIGFKRRAIFAPIKKRDLRLGNWLYLHLEAPLKPGAQITVRSGKAQVIPPTYSFKGAWTPDAVSKAIHVPVCGYLAKGPKVAPVGHYLGSTGELGLEAGTPFQIEDSAQKVVFSGELKPRPDSGWEYKPYQQVMEADFSTLAVPGRYRLAVPGLGVSPWFTVGDEAAAMLGRTYALGLLNQRCGTSVELPYSRHTHVACHLAEAEIPTNEYTATNRHLAGMSTGAERDPKNTAPRLVDVQSALIPFVKKGNVDVTGGHHDAGDYSVYTTNSAQLISFLCLAADAFPGAGDLDNLGLPESGDGKSDLLQEAKWEADFLVKMQDDDGGFYFLKYPRDRKYENDVLPERGDPQVVFPKNTASTAAATAALAQMATSPRFARQFPREAAVYAAAAKRGWAFVEAAIAKFGRDGAYQKVSHYGDLFRHEDEITWAAVEMYFLTGDKDIHQKYLDAFVPGANTNLRWGWVRLYEAYGSAIREYALAVHTGRAKESQLDARLLKEAREQVVLLADEQSARAKANAYGTSFPLETKRMRTAGWYFSSVNTFDLAAGYVLAPKPEFLRALLSNFGFEWGANPQNMPLVTGVGEHRQRDIVHQYGQNDRRVLPPAGIPQGSIVGGFFYLDNYKRELGQTTFPFDGDNASPYAPMDRWGDSFNVTAEFTVSQQAAALGGAAFLMGGSSLKNQPWRTQPVEITGLPQVAKAGVPLQAQLQSKGLDLTGAHVVWEATEMEPASGARFSYVPPAGTPLWVEGEALLPDGRRVAATTTVQVLPTGGGATAQPAAGAHLLLNFDDAGVTPAEFAAYVASKGGKVTGVPHANAENLTWMAAPAGRSLALETFDDEVILPVGALPADFELSARVYYCATRYGAGPGTVVALCGAGVNEPIIGLGIDKYPKPQMMDLRVTRDVVVKAPEMVGYVIPNRWQYWQFQVRGEQVRALVDGKLVYEGKMRTPAMLKPNGGVKLIMGRAVGALDDICVRPLPAN